MSRSRTRVLSNLSLPVPDNVPQAPEFGEEPLRSCIFALASSRRHAPICPGIPRPPDQILIMAQNSMASISLGMFERQACPAFLQIPASALRVNGLGLKVFGSGFWDLALGHTFRG